MTHLERARAFAEIWAVNRHAREEAAHRVTLIEDLAALLAQVTNEAYERAAEVCEPGTKPCDCIEPIPGTPYFAPRCYCGNLDDLERASSWCADSAKCHTIRSLKVSP